ncbi:bifunctional phosphopantothenoylcysteine decarboxylase/phosphopantothenate synthase [Lichenihabitans sp. PAMC28606]|uniref:bifunctional phosphopantothenoylcysteine decarboxylase/phosphopantothenate synthase n=1 Tax=Lichenihabitans sp. PAMC28606 TaxID=2880932 RepID=UPI001D0A7265|nr:phosphopantothenoylcysteine decarboxylase [Lichenihabitans sp. PAMC28606]UDL94502.1 bifunctional phosphopantothenoylcysteine decarboxylase/phosphopantothenate synthase [Lichenihabitans sp. PAMC28606]
MTNASNLPGKRILLVIGGGIAAYKCLEVARHLARAGAKVRAVMTPAAHHFVTPLSVGSVTGDKVFTDLFSLTDEAEMGHIQLSRDADLIVVAPATANLLAKMAHGIVDDLATTVLLATDTRVLVAPAMNLRMWLHPATLRNVDQLRRDGVMFVGPTEGSMACGEYGPGRLAEPLDILAAIDAALAHDTAVALPPGITGRPPEKVRAPDETLAGRRVIVTSGPTHEPVDPVRYLANRSSGRQGHAIAIAAAAAGAEVVLVSGPVDLPDPAGMTVVHVETALQMLAAVEQALPSDILVAAAAVADWRPAEPQPVKIKKQRGDHEPALLRLMENPDILATVAHRTTERPTIVVGFAAETDHLLDHAAAKLARKGCDLLVANDVSPDSGIMGGDMNEVHLLTRTGVESWPRLSKDDVAARLVARIAEMMKAPS